MTKKGRTVRLLGSLTAALALASAAAAHDLWLRPESFRPEPGEPLAVRILVGEGFQGEPVRPSRERIVSFQARGPGGTELPVPGLPGGEVAGYLRLPGPGLYQLVYQSRPAAISLPGEKFQQYLREEGLEKALELRAARGEEETPGRERYSRCAKALVLVGATGHGGEVAPRPPAGCPLELLVEGSSGAALEGGQVAFRLLFRGEALAGALVEAQAEGGPVSPAWTGADGLVSFQLTSGASWLVTAVHMEPAPPASDADWESWWASLAFETLP